MNNQTGHNWMQFQHGGTQFGTPGSASYTPAAAQSGYVTPSYTTTSQQQQRTTGYDQSQTYASQTYATTAQPYEYGYGRPTQAYDTTKTYYQQAGQNYVAPTYDSSATNAAAKAATSYAQPPRTTIQQKATQYSTSYATAKQPQQQQHQQAANTSSTYSSYDTALYSAATVYMAQQNKTANTQQQQTGWPNKKGQAFKPRKNPAPKPQQIHYCDVCKISCAGPQTYREHLEGQKHKKREALQKAQQDPQQTTTAVTTQRGSNLRCELCDVTCTGNDAYSAHVRGSKHQKVVKLHTKLGKPIPSADPTPVGAKEKEGEDNETPSEDVKPVGEEYIEEMKDADGKVVTFNCKLCDCKFNDPNAKEMHTKGRRHRLQYKKKVQPDLVVDVKPTLRQRKLAEREKQRHAMHDDFWNRRRMGDGENEDEERLYWEERRREEEMGNPGMAWTGNFPRVRPLMGFPPMFNMMNGRRVETLDDRHVIARHAEIYPKEEELQAIQKIVSHTERALKLVSDAMTVQVQEPVKEEKMEVQTDNDTNKTNGTETKTGSENKENGSGNQNQMISFQKDTEGTVRLLKGVMRVGLLAKGLLLQGDDTVQLVVLCAEKPTSGVLKRVLQELPIQLKKVGEDSKYTVTMAPVEGAVLVTDGSITVKVSLTSPLLREPADNNTESVSNSEDLLPREPCLQALRSLRQSKWFQARATGLQSCVMIMRILRDLCQRNPTFSPLNQWAMELLTEKVIASASIPLSPGDCLRRIMECLSSGFLLSHIGIMDPCEKEPVDALNGLSKQQREDITMQSQQFLRFIAFRQIHKVLGMDPLPVQKYQGNRPWKFNTSRKRRRSGTEPSEGDSQKLVKKEGENNVSESGAAEKMN
ncbi:hypothetical protein PVAND_006011 [Polypedilum vanderplanki]|uniref:DZF domain-containing protein n=1 Tax=Polypedilum vanderplanki TaxID=319348 RepID=A0A9J6C2B4_POLVA|nr:hypothetical protein PVAND_006011 [Polypedilum vanderplanki]